MVAKFIRALQSTLTLFLYGRLALQSLKKEHLVARVLLPATIIYVIYNIIILVDILFSRAMDCFHPSWLLLSASGVIVSGMPPAPACPSPPPPTLLLLSLSRTRTHAHSHPLLLL